MDNRLVGETLLVSGKLKDKRFLKSLCECRKDILDIQKDLIVILKDVGASTNEINDTIWENVWEMCRLYNRHDFNEKDYKELYKAIKYMYPYMNFTNNLLRKGKTLGTYIEYLNRTNYLKDNLGPIKILSGSKWIYRINSGNSYIEQELSIDVKFTRGYQIPVLRLGRYKNTYTGVIIENNGTIRQYDDTIENLKELLVRLLNYDYQRAYVPSLSLIRNKLTEYIDIDSLSMKNFLNLLKLIGALDLDFRTNLNKYKRLEDCEYDIKNFLISIFVKNHYDLNTIFLIDDKENKWIKVLENLKPKLSMEDAEMCEKMIRWIG